MGRESCAGSVCCGIVVVFFVVGLPLIFVFTGHNTKDPDFSIIDTSISTFNLSSDDKLLFILNIHFLVHNPDSKRSQSYSGLEVSVRKGKHHPIADDVFWGFHQDPLNNTVLKAEAVAVYKQLERKIAAELREDLAKGVGSVNIFLSGGVRSKILKVTCKNVVVQFSKSTDKFSQIDCGVDTYDPAQQ